MKQITARLHMWSEYLPAERLDRNGYFAQGAAGEPGALVDPVPFQTGDRAQLAELGGAAAVVLTGADEERARGAASLQRELGCAVYAPVAAVDGLARHGLSEVQGFGDWERLPGGLMADTSCAVEAGDAALFHAESRGWLVGSLVTGAPAGALSLPAGLEGEVTRARAARALRRLNAVGFERLLVARGTPVLHDATRLVQDLAFKEDPEACVVRPSEVQFAPGRQRGTTYGRKDAVYGRLLGLKTLDFDLSEVEPGRRSTAVHRHDGDEECFIFLSGEGEVHLLRPGESELRRVPVKAGDVVGFPPRYQIAHSFKCTGSEPLRFISFGAPGEEVVGVVDYPLSGTRLTYARPPGKVDRFYLPERRDVPYYENEPDA
jgi:uncharacterized cupin superfamily protein